VSNRLFLDDDPLFVSFLNDDPVDVFSLNNDPLDVSSMAPGSRSRTLITVKSDSPWRGRSFVADENLEEEEVNSDVDILFDVGISMLVLLEDENSRGSLEGVEVSI
jgi:hypothetical protein